jgi:putative transposase
VSEASVYRLLKAHDLIASPAFIVMKAALSTVLDDFSRYIIAWKRARRSSSWGKAF